LGCGSARRERLDARKRFGIVALAVQQVDARRVAVEPTGDAVLLVESVGERAVVGDSVG
jgi:hypothetical protein